MKVGTIELPVKEKKTVKRRTRVGGGFGAGGGTPYRGGGDDGSGGGGGNNYKGNFLGEVNVDPKRKYRVLMFFLLLVVLMTFGTLIGAFAVISSKEGLPPRHFILPVEIWLSTFFILASSLTYLIYKKAIISEKQKKAQKWLLATGALGAMFVFSQGLVWLDLIRRGVFLKSNPYAGFFYILTSVHALHVIGGMIALGYLVFRIRRATFSSEELVKRKEISNTVGWYWHTMDGLWMLLLLLILLNFRG